jgi:hypothetical protein
MVSSTFGHFSRLQEVLSLLWALCQILGDVSFSSLWGGSQPLGDDVFSPSWAPFNNP